MRRDHGQFVCGLREDILPKGPNPETRRCRSATDHRQSVIGDVLMGENNRLVTLRVLRFDLGEVDEAELCTHQSACRIPNRFAEHDDGVGTAA